jgi:hypothetical protein
MATDCIQGGNSTHTAQPQPTSLLLFFSCLDNENAGWRPKKLGESCIATGLIAQRVHVLIFCFRETKIRLISLRKANPREVKRYARNH